jgi:D-beta-D-heptose 7-phosphate kinase/D-beta-D-heptose 1-phosphate adenosyltransferase
VKTRHLAGVQQLLRVDEESTAPLSAPLTKQLLQKAAEILPHVSVMILSDYGKGVLTEEVCQALITMAKKQNCVVIVDPKGKDYTKYIGADYVTPNRQELELASGLATETDDDIIVAARALLTRYDLAGVIATRSAKGMSFVPKKGEVVHLPTEALKVFDVSGAGDTVVAMLAAALAAGGTLPEAMQLATTAAGIVVQKIGTAATGQAEVYHALRMKNHQQHYAGKIMPLEVILPQIQMWRDEGLKVGFTNGCFDILHTGHLALLSEARATCDKLIVALNSDASVRRLKGATRPVNQEQDRATVIAALETVDAVVVFSEDTPENLLHKIRPDVLVKGADYTIETVVGAPFVQSYGGKVVLAGLKAGYSTTNLIEKMQVRPN